MGSFVGHIDEAVFFILLSLWWMVNMFHRYIMSTVSRCEYTSKLSYPLPGKRFIPLEAILKTLFPLAGLAGEIISEGIQLIDDEGNFRKLAQMQHMSIYSIFITHGIIDVLMSFNVPLFRGADYLSASFAFFWYGLSFSFHAHMHGKEVLESMIHVLPIPIMYIVSGVALVEMMFPHFIQISMIRNICLMILGTWFTQAAFVMYIPYPWPGTDLNPRWNQVDERNVHAIVATFGFHIILAIIITVTMYACVYAYLKLANKLPYTFQPIAFEDDDVTRRNGRVVSNSKAHSNRLLDEDDLV